MMALSLLSVIQFDEQVGNWLLCKLFPLHALFFLPAINIFSPFVKNHTTQ